MSFVLNPVRSGGKDTKPLCEAVTTSLEQELFDASIHHITLPLAVVSRLRAPWLMKSTAVHPTHLK